MGTSAKSTSLICLLSNEARNPTDYFKKKKKQEKEGKWLQKATSPHYQAFSCTLFSFYNIMIYVKEPEHIWKTIWLR